MQADDRFMRLAEVRKAVALSRSTIYRMAERGGYPQPVKLGERSSAWVESEVRAWMQRRRGTADLDAWVPRQGPEAPVAPRDIGKQRSR